MQLTKNENVFLIESFARHFRTVFRMWRARFDMDLRSSGLSLSRAMAVVNLAEAQEPMSQKLLAQSLFVEEATLVRLLDGLEEAGIVRRRAADGDRRVKHVVLTEKAAPLVEIVRELVKSLRLRVLADIPPQKLAVALEVLQMIEKNLEKEGMK